MDTTTLLPVTRIITYDRRFRGQDKDKKFATFAASQRWLVNTKPRRFNVYRMEKQNGTWRTDWNLVCQKEEKR